MTLIERLQALTAPDREVDYAIFIATAAREKPTHWHPTIGNQFTASLDAAIALTEKLFPNERIWVNRINFDGLKQWRASLTGSYVSWGSTPAIALLIATLTAKESKDEV